jgi:antitoxin component YwqK of YwqJK toxin-antitoxin module
MKNLKTLIITLTFLSLESYAGWFSPEISICDKLEDSVQHRNGRVYLPNQANGFTGLNECVWTSNEQQSDLGRYSNGKKDGVWTTWYRNGQKESKVDYDDGRKDGKWTHWYENGKKYSEENYDDGVKDGKHVRWNKSGDLVFKGSYNNGNKDGKWTHWYENGKKYSEENYDDGVKDGKHVRWNKSGDLVFKGSYNNGNKDGKWFVTSDLFLNEMVDGQLYDPYSFTKKNIYLVFDNGKKDGEYIERDSLGNIVLKGLFNNGIKDGNWFSKIQLRINDKEIWSPEDNVHPIFDNGKLVGKWRRNWKGKEIKLNMDGTDHLGEDRIIKSKSLQGMIKNGQKDSWWWVIGEGGPYKDDKKEGFWEFWENGQRTLAGTYKNGIRDSWWGTYSNDQITSEGIYKNGKRDGIWETYSNERLTSTGSYKNGKKVGEWRRWDRNDEMTKSDHGE